MTLQIRACGLSDVGRSRPHNEDYFEIDTENNLYIVADGMGGHGNGEVASRLAVRAIGEYLQRPASPRPRRASGDALREHSVRLKSAIGLAHEKVVRAVQRDDSLVGMGTTVVGFSFVGGVAAVAHVGDSRAYRLRDGVLERVTTDHTWVNEQVVAGLLSEDQARSHPLRSVVTRALGGDREVEVDIRELDVRAGDLYLLCSDGLTTMLNDAEILQALQSSDSLEAVCRRLVGDANLRGGLDNVTVVLLAVEPS